MDLRFVLRKLAAAPGFTAIAIATLALGIGFSTVVFTIYASVALRRLPARAPEEIVRIRWQTDGSSPSASSDQFSWTEYQRIAQDPLSLASVIATSSPQTIVCGLRDSSNAAATEIAKVRFVSSNYFRALGIDAKLGRTFAPDDSAVAVLSHGFWTARLDGDPQVLGRTLRVQGRALTVIGVAPEQFAGTGAPPQAPDLWIPASAQTLAMPGVDWTSPAGPREWQVLARRRHGVGAGRASAQLAVLGDSWPLDAGKRVHLTASEAMFFETGGGAFSTFITVCAILMAAVGLVLLIGAVNLTHLIAARNADRDQEIALRIAFGAGRWRLLRLFSTESLILGLTGGMVGLLVSGWTCDWLGAKAAELIPSITNGAVAFSFDLSPNRLVLAWTTIVSILTGIAVGIVPALGALRRDPNSALKLAGAGATGSTGRRRSRGLLLAAQVASCIILLAGAGLLFRGASRVAAIDAGFDYHHLAIVGLDTRALAATPAARVGIQRQALARLQDVPAVSSVAWADRPPFLGTGSGDFRNEQGDGLRCVFNGVSDQYFSTVGIPVISGRVFSRREVEEQPPLAVISEAAARRLFPGQDALGRRIFPDAAWLQNATGHPSFAVIGVVKTVRSTYLSKEDDGYIYFPKRMNDMAGLFLVRMRTAPAASLKRLSAALAAADPSLAARCFVVSLEQGPVRIQELMTRAPAVAASVIGGLALLLACLGIYGVVSRLVAGRTREIGIRMALGARRQDIVRTVVSETLPPVAWGAALGLLGAFGISGMLRALIVMPDVPDLTYGAGAFDPMAFLGVLGLLGTVVFIAAFLPLRRATRVDAAVALRNA